MGSQFWGMMAFGFIFSFIAAGALIGAFDSKAYTTKWLYSGIAIMALPMAVLAFHKAIIP